MGFSIMGLSVGMENGGESRRGQQASARLPPHKPNGFPKQWTVVPETPAS
jgi:hypothetical protein